MDRRKAMKVAAGAIVGGGAGLFVLTNAFKPKVEFDNEPHKLDYNQAAGSWSYTPLEPAVTAELAYKFYSDGSCMYAIILSVVSQMADKYGEPFASFPIHLFKYGHGGIGGYGSTCGTLNGAAALIGLFITDKSIQDKMIANIFRWFEQEPLPEFIPQNPNYDYLPVKSISNSVLCHASNTNWCKTAGFKVDSNERKERCRRLTCDVAEKVTTALNDIFYNNYLTNVHNDRAVNTCVTCHGSEGKINNTAVKMSCKPCHTESIAHKVFADIHYKMMK